MIHVSRTNTKLKIEIKKQLNKDFENICDWFVDNKLNIHFGENKTKYILFASKYHIDIKQHSQVAYLACMLDETMSD